MKYILLATIALVALGGAGMYLTSAPTSEGQNVAKKQQTAQRQAAPATEEYLVDQADYVAADTLIGEITVTELSATEVAGLQFMREEEKLARDVYQTLYDQWGTQIFSNIAQSEQTHMDAIKILLDRYAIEDVARSERGAFANTELQQLYTELTQRGKTSLTDAYQVGALIEDLDIKDLETYIAATDKEDIKIVYENLARGSRNHLRAFNRQIVRVTGANYVPQYISQTAFDTIIAEDTERGPAGGRGRGFMNR